MITPKVGAGTNSSSYILEVADGPSTLYYANTSHFGATSGFVNNTTAGYNNASMYCAGSALFNRWIAAISDTRIKRE